MTASTKARKRAELRRARGLPNTVPLERVRNHIAELNELGITHTMISLAAGIGRSTAGGVLHRSSEFVRLDTAAAILQVTHLPVPSQSTVLTVGARRRIRALNAIGWPTSELGRRLGQSSRSTLNLTLADDYTTYAMWRRIRDLYDQLSGTRGPSSQSAKRAHNAGHPPPLAWEGRDIDHPREQPDWKAAGITLAQRAECSRGHAYTPANTYRRPNGNRICRTCTAAAAARRHATKAS